MLLQALKQFLLILLKLSRHAYQFAHTRVLRLQKRHQTRSHEQKGGLAVRFSARRVAIVVLSSDNHAAPFIVNLMNGLAENGFFILAVAARKLPPDLKNSVLSHCHHVIEKFSIRPDFGSIKTGWEWIKKNDALQGIDKLAIANDSLYYPKRISSTIGQMLALKGDWLSLFESSPLPAHPQSFFQILRAPVFKADAFEEFWHNDAITTARLHEIVTGETGLASALLKAGFASQAYYHVARVQADILAALENESIPAGLQDALSLTLGFERNSKNGRLPPRAQGALTLPVSEVARRIGKLAEGNNPAHALGLLCNYLYQAPVKRDICSYNALDAHDLLALVQGFSVTEKKAMTADLARLSIAANIAGIRKLPQRFVRTAQRKQDS